MIVAVPVTEDGSVDHRWGKADQVAIADISDDKIQAWEVYDVGWHRQHDAAGHGRHHATIVRFLLDNKVQAVVIDHAGASMINTMQKMGLKIILDASGPAREAALLAAS